MPWLLPTLVQPPVPIWVISLLSPTQVIPLFLWSLQFSSTIFSLSPSSVLFPVSPSSDKMYSQTLKGPVHPQDLLLVFGGKLRPRMLLVESVSSAPVDSISANLGSQVAAGSVTHISTPTPTGSTSKTNDSDVNISSILVREIPYAYTSNGGHWTLDGPTVYFTTDDDETSSVEDSDDSHSTKSSHHSLDHYMPPDVGVKAIINPHGR